MATPEHVWIRGNAKEVTVTHEASLDGLDTMLAPVLGRLRMLMQSGDMLGTMNYLHDGAYHLHCHLGLTLDSVTVSRIEGEINVSAVFEAS